MTNQPDHLGAAREAVARVEEQIVYWRRNPGFTGEELMAGAHSQATLPLMRAMLGTAQGFYDAHYDPPDAFDETISLICGEIIRVADDVCGE